MLEVTEIYKSVQGESTYMGLPCVFIRLTGCNLRCVWCDTAHAFHDGEKLSILQIIDKVKSYDIKLVEITGGEPLLQKEVFPLMESLLKNEFKVMLETSGSLAINNVPAKVIKIIDLKCPGSGEENKNLWENLNHLTPTDEIKFVIADKADYEWSKKVLQDYELDKKVPVLFSPVFEKLKLKDLTEWILEDNLPVRLHTQLHKYIWDQKTIGV
ncbi:MAG: radical SAM protein [Nitrospinaceae bacterium]|jgi:7-carboxy-7-deazaguanine synthase|tara:strand:- start:202 stop:840 length:639 start_codon:yes stop_codon:yes gene_type:complete